MSDPSTPESKTAERTRRRRDEPVADTLTRLAAQWPALFSRPVPLAIGTFAAIRASDFPVSHRALRQAITRWCGHTTYLQAVAADGSERVGIDGSRSAVSDAHRARAAAELAKRLADYQQQRHHHPQQKPRTTADASAAPAAPSAGPAPAAGPSRKPRRDAGPPAPRAQTRRDKGNPRGASGRPTAAREDRPRGALAEALAAAQAAQARRRD